MAFSGIWALLYGGTRRRHNPRKDQHIDMAGTRPRQGAGASIDRGARGQHVVDQHQPAPGNIRFMLRSDPEGALYIIGALVFDLPTCCGVARNRLRPPWTIGTPVNPEITPARAAD